MSDIFISYTHSDRTMAEKLAKALEGEGLSVWWDLRLQGGERFEDVIGQALEDCKCVIVLWSRRSVNSQYVRDEANFALNRKKLMPVMIEEVKLPFRYEGLHTPALLNWDGSKSSSEFRIIVADVSRIATQTPQSSTENSESQEEEPKGTTPRSEPLIESPFTFTVAPLAHIEMSETRNAVSLANLTQESFKFVFDPRTVSIREEKYRLPNGALDLVSAVRDLTRKQTFKTLASKELILLTSKPDADKESTNDAATAFENECYFMRETLPFAQNVALVSTYIWDRLPRTAAIPTNASGRRALQPYLLFAFSIIALARSIGEPLAYHFETQGCPLDRCDEVQEIDRVFTAGRFCDRCEGMLERMKKKGKLPQERLDSVRALLLRADIGQSS